MIQNALSKEDIKKIHYWLDTYSESPTVMPEEDIESNFLCYWACGKKQLYKAFGEKLILSKSIKDMADDTQLYKRIKEEILYPFDKYWHHLSNSEIIIPKPDIEQAKMFVFLTNWQNLMNTYASVLQAAGVYEQRNYVCLYCLPIDEYSLKTNTVNYEYPLIIPMGLTVDSKPLIIKPGTKLMRAISKILRALGVYEEWKEYFEAYRNIHSRILNDATVNKCTLNLSIHPLDFLTMSDNDCGWTSCMSWKDHIGEYRSGTLEMMASPCVVIAYVASSTPFDMGDGRTWTNKKWRELFVVDREIILGVKQYPYINNDFELTCLEWLRELVQTIGWANYEEKARYIDMDIGYSYGENATIYFDFTTGLMYNDIYDVRCALLNKDFLNYCFGGNNHIYHFQKPIDGVAPCVCCGKQINDMDYWNEEIYYENVHCVKCDKKLKRCNSCERIVLEDKDFFTTNDGYQVCSYCYEHYTSQCVCCDSVMLHDYLSAYLKTFSNNDIPSLRIPICAKCNKNSEYEKYFGKYVKKENGYSHYSGTLNSENITKEGFELMRKCFAEHNDSVGLSIVDKFEANSKL